MSDEATPSPGPFDVRTVRYLVRLMSRFDLSEIDLHEGDRRIRLRRGLPVSTQALAPAPLHAAPPLPTAHAPAPSPAPAAEPSRPARQLTEIKSELVGTFYSRPKPEADDYVKVGARVTPDTVVGLIEAMKIFNEVKAGCSGVIAEIKVKNQDFVEFNSVLFLVDPNG